MLSFFRKAPKDPLRQKVKELKCRQIHYVDKDFDTVAANMDSDCKAILSLVPVNYYAVKEKYIMAKVYSNKDFTENYAEFFRYDSDKLVSSTKLFPLDKVTASKAFAKVGIIIK
ncbi:hypothetical protein [Ruminococcus sp. FC2018]|uniref:hypothetical protein n=1 Tax=Ruminococcus sp. FC2018 TaxID=1410617 RepID=UPI00048DD39B|nr:hypothetical protein [Ruminococcus sp. FC2018]